MLERLLKKLLRFFGNWAGNYEEMIMEEQTNLAQSWDEYCKQQWDEYYKVALDNWCEQAEFQQQSLIERGN